MTTTTLTRSNHDDDDDNDVVETKPIVRNKQSRGKGVIRKKFAKKLCAEASITSLHIAHTKSSFEICK